MKFSKETSLERAKKDLAHRLGTVENEISHISTLDFEFRDMSLGASADGEMAAQMISNGWKIQLKANGKNFEYRGDKYQLRLHDFKGKNYLVESF